MLMLSLAIHPMNSKKGFEISTIQCSLPFTDSYLVKILPFIYNAIDFLKHAFEKTVLYNFI